MPKEERKKLLETLSATAHGRALRDFLEEKIDEIKDVENCTSWEDTLGRKYAVKMLREILSFLSDKKEDKRTPNQYT